MVVKISKDPKLSKDNLFAGLIKRLFSGKNTKFSPSRVAQIVGSWDPRPCQDSGDRERNGGKTGRERKGLTPEKFHPQGLKIPSGMEVALLNTTLTLMVCTAKPVDFVRIPDNCH